VSRDRALRRRLGRVAVPPPGERFTEPPCQSRSVAVSLRGLSKTYPGGHEAVREISLDVYEGEFFAVLGPSGSGKTSTLRMIGGFEHPTAGGIEIGARDVTDQLPFQRNVNTVFQSYALFPHLDVFGNVAFGLRMKRVPRSEREHRVTEILQMVQLDRLRDRRVSQLSGGEQQRVALARALVNQPAVLLLDEPLGSLDLKLRREMQRELKSIQERVGITFIHVTHDQDEAIALADRIAVMHDGSILQVGTPQEIYERPQDRFVASFIGSTNLFEGSVLRVEADAVAVEVPNLGAVVASRTRRPASTVSPGDRVAVAVRPESVHLVETGHRTPSAPVNSYRGSIAQTMYGGSETSYEVLLEGGARLDVRVPVQVGAKPLRQGDDIEVSWSREAVAVLRG
jgi:spermidine/putrescine ABC transporter ATP-binding subunit